MSALGEREGGVEFDPEDPVGFRGADRRDEGVRAVDKDMLVLNREARREQLARRGCCLCSIGRM
jgi:hypothetical protein